MDEGKGHGTLLKPSGCFGSQLLGLFDSKHGRELREIVREEHSGLISALQGSDLEMVEGFRRVCG
jgi:hypothetical protein